MKKTLIIVFILILTALAVYGNPYPDTISRRVTDMANVIPAGEVTKLEKQLDTLKVNTGVDMVVAVFPALEGNLEETANRLANKWQVGTRNKDNGLVFFIFLKSEGGGGKTRFEVAQGLQGVVTDGRTKVLYENKVKPFLKNKDFAGGIRAAIQGIESFYPKPAPPEIVGPPIPKNLAKVDAVPVTESSEGNGIICVLVILFALGLSIWLIFCINRSFTEKMKKEAEAEERARWDSIRRQNLLEQQQKDRARIQADRTAREEALQRRKKSTSSYTAPVTPYETPYIAPYGESTPKPKPEPEKPKEKTKKKSSYDSGSSYGSSSYDYGSSSSSSSSSYDSGSSYSSSSYDSGGGGGFDGGGSSGDF